MILNGHVHNLAVLAVYVQTLDADNLTKAHSTHTSEGQITKIPEIIASFLQWTGIDDPATLTTLFLVFFADYQSTIMVFFSNT